MRYAIAVAAMLLFTAPSHSAEFECSEAGGNAALRQSRATWSGWCTSCGGAIKSKDGNPVCEPGPNWRSGKVGTSAASGSLIEQSINYGAQSGDVGGALLGVGIGILAEDLFAPEDPAAQQRKIEAERHAALQRAQAQEREREAQKDRIVSQLKGYGGLASAPTEVPEANTLGLKLGDPQDAMVAAHTVSATQQGMRDATGCFEPRPALFCLNDPDRWACEKSYRDAFANGLIATNERLKRAYAAGREARTSGDRSPHTEAFDAVPMEDTCRVKLLNEYSRGYAEAR